MAFQQLKPIPTIKEKETQSGQLSLQGIRDASI